MALPEGPELGLEQALGLGLDAAARRWNADLEDEDEEELAPARVELTVRGPGGEFVHVRRRALTQGNRRAVRAAFWAFHAYLTALPLAVFRTDDGEPPTALHAGDGGGSFDLLARRGRAAASSWLAAFPERCRVAVELKTGGLANNLLRWLREGAETLLTADARKDDARFPGARRLASVDAVLYLSRPWPSEDVPAPEVTELAFDAADLREHGAQARAVYARGPVSTRALQVCGLAAHHAWEVLEEQAARPGAGGAVELAAAVRELYGPGHTGGVGWLHKALKRRLPAGQNDLDKNARGRWTATVAQLQAPAAARRAGRQAGAPGRGCVRVGGTRAPAGRLPRVLCGRRARRAGRAGLRRAGRSGRNGAETERRERGARRNGAAGRGGGGGKEGNPEAERRDAGSRT